MYVLCCLRGEAEWRGVLTGFNIVVVCRSVCPRSQSQYISFSQCQYINISILSDIEDSRRHVQVEMRCPELMRTPADWPKVTRFNWLSQASVIPHVQNINTKNTKTTHHFSGLRLDFQTTHGNIIHMHSKFVLFLAIFFNKENRYIKLLYLKNIIQIRDDMIIWYDE